MAAKLASFIVLCSCLLGCQSAPLPAPRATSLVLSQPLTVPADRAALEIQAGEVKDGARIDRYRPYCRFELAQLAGMARTIAPGRYSVVREYETVPAARAPRGLQFARWVRTSGDPSYFVFATVFELAANDAGLSRLSCRHWEPPAPNRPRHLTQDEIRTALGTLARLE